MTVLLTVCMNHHESSVSDATVILELETSHNFLSVCVVKPAVMATVLFKERRQHCTVQRELCPPFEKPHKQADFMTNTQSV